MLNFSKMKVVFIKNSWFPLTQGKTYEVIDSKQTPEQERPHMYKIINDDGKQRWYDKSLFMPLEEWRELKLNEILKEE